MTASQYKASAHVSFNLVKIDAMSVKTIVLCCFLQQTSVILLMKNVLESLKINAPLEGLVSRP